jgi:Protein of unknown function (DUF2568)
MCAFNGANFGLRFVLELAALAALAIFGAHATSSTAGNVVLAIAAPAIANGVVLRRFREERRASSSSRLRPESRVPPG